MDCHAQHYQRDTHGVLDGGDLAEHDRADDGGEGRQQGQHQRERRPRQPAHGQLIGHVRDDRGAHADPGPGQQQDRISPSGGGLRLIPGIAREVPNVTECYRITGEDCYFMKVWLHSIDDLEQILDLFTPHGRTTTSIVHSAPVPPRPLPVPGPTGLPLTLPPREG